MISTVAFTKHIYVLVTNTTNYYKISVACKALNHFGFMSIIQYSLRTGVVRTCSKILNVSMPVMALGVVKI